MISITPGFYGKVYKLSFGKRNYLSVRLIHTPQGLRRFVYLQILGKSFGKIINVREKK